MKNIEIEVTDNHTIVVFADTKRFGKHQIMFEGITFDECFDYIRKHTGREHFQMQSYLLYDTFTDRKGKTFPISMNVII